MFLILTEAGKPVYSSKACVNLGEITGIIATFYEFFLKDSCKLLSINCSKSRIVFLKRNLLIFTHIQQEKTMLQSEELVLKFLQEKSDLLVFYFTKNSLKNTLNENPNTELKVVSSIKGKLRGDYVVDLLYLHQSTQALKVSCRPAIAKVLSKVHASAPAFRNILTCLLISGTKIVSSKRMHTFKMDLQDLLLLIVDFSTLNQENTEIWMPVCLPRLNSNGFFWVYGVFLSPKLSLLSITTEKEGFSICSMFAKDIITGLRGLKEMDSLAQSIRADPLHLVEIGIPGILHFFYKSKVYMQVVMPKNAAPYTYNVDWKRLIMKYQGLALKLKETRVNFLLHNGEKELIIATQTSLYELYIVLGPLATMEDALLVHSKLLSWLKTEHESLFLTCNPIF